MRFMLKVNIPVEEGNEAARAGTLASTIKRIMDDLNPEAAYFTDNDGERACFFILNLEEACEIPKVAEPFFLAFNAAVEIHPVMVPEDLEKAGPSIARAVGQYGRT